MDLEIHCILWSEKVKRFYSSVLLVFLLCVPHQDYGTLYLK